MFSFRSKAIFKLNILYHMLLLSFKFKFCMIFREQPFRFKYFLNLAEDFNLQIIIDKL